MSSPYLSEVRIFAFGFVPKGWAACAGQILPINQNQALFSLLGTTYGGNGTTTFALPDLRGRIPVHFGTGATGTYSLGQVAGEEKHTLLLSEMPSHTHPANASTTTADQTYPTNNLWAAGSSDPGFHTASNANMDPALIGLTGSNQGHENMSPFLTLNFCIAMVGIFPSRN